MVAHAGAALLSLLKESDEVLEEVPAGRIVGGELTPDLIAVMPTSALLVTEAGGTRPASQAPIFRARVDVRAYNRSPWSASKLSVVMHRSLQGVVNQVAADTTVLGVTLSSGPVPFTEPDLPDWFATIRTYAVLINEVPSS